LRSPHTTTTNLLRKTERFGKSKGKEGKKKKKRSPTENLHEKKGSLKGGKVVFKKEKKVKEKSQVNENWVAPAIPKCLRRGPRGKGGKV